MTFSFLIMGPLCSGLLPIFSQQLFTLIFYTPNSPSIPLPFLVPLYSEIRETITDLITTPIPPPRHVQIHIYYIARIDYPWYVVSQELALLSFSKTDRCLLYWSDQGSQPNFLMFSLIFAFTYIIIQLSEPPVSRGKKKIYVFPSLWPYS